MLRHAIALAGLAALLAAAPAREEPSFAVAPLGITDRPYVAGSRLRIAMRGPFGTAVLGPGSVEGDTYTVPDSARSGVATLAAASAGMLGMQHIRIAAPPSADTEVLAVASYDEGVVFHRASAPFAVESVLGIAGAPGDVAVDSSGDALAAAATDGTMLALVGRSPWRVAAVGGVPFTDELAFDSRTHAVFATNRDVAGAGAVTRVSPDGTVVQRVLGLTSEGVALDAKRRRVYVANANDGTISVVDADTMAEIRRIAAVPRAFGLALSTNGARLYAVSNQSVTSPFSAAGSVVAIDVLASVPRVVARSAPLAFPVSAAFDAASQRVFVTDERDDVVYVLDARTLRARAKPLQTCRTPWKPSIAGERLFVPCARADAVDVFTLPSLRRGQGAPFHTGGFPLAVAVWQPDRHVKR